VRRRRWRRTIQRTPSASSFPLRQWGRRRGRSYRREVSDQPSSASRFTSTIAAAPAAPSAPILPHGHARRYTLSGAHDFFGSAQQVSLYAGEARREHEVRADFPDRHRGPAPAINAKVPAQNLQEFIALLKANPGRYRYGSSGLGAIMPSERELFGFMSETDVVHVPYRGEGPATVDLLAGRISFHGGQRSRAAAACPLRRTARFVRERRSSPGVAA